MVGAGRAHDDAVLVYGSVLGVRGCRWAVTIRYTAATRTAAPVIAVLSSYIASTVSQFLRGARFWSALHGFVLLEMTGVMDDIDTDAVFTIWCCGWRAWKGAPR